MIKEGSISQWITYVIVLLNEGNVKLKQKNAAIHRSQACLKESNA